MASDYILLTKMSDVNHNQDWEQILEQHGASVKIELQDGR